MNEFLNSIIPLTILFTIVSLFEPFIINTIYLSNIDLFLDLFLTKKKRFKLVNHILEHYTIINNELVYKDECNNNRR